MHSLEILIKKLNSQFLMEAKSSPLLLADMAAMEKYMAESYSGRIFIELLQNADDSESHIVLLEQVGKDLYFANNGRPFNENDVAAICRSGASFKERGKTIGYRGIGFKSTTYLSNEILIYSNDVCFTFSKSICAKQLEVPIEQVPTVRIPFIADGQMIDAQEYIDKLVQDGFTTIFVFRNANMDTLRDEINAINDDCFLFLRSISKCLINTEDNHDKYIITRHSLSNYYDICIESRNNKRWRVYPNEKTDICFALDKEQTLCPCLPEEAIYHCYLPTLDKSPFYIKINGDFSTDPSRKHISTDPATSEALRSVVNQITTFIETALIEPGIQDGSHLLSIFCNTASFSTINTSMLKDLKERLIGMPIFLSDGNTIPLGKYKLFPDWLEGAEVTYIRSNCECIRKQSLPLTIYRNNDKIDSFISKYSDMYFSLDDLVAILSDEDFCSELSSSTYSKVLMNVVKQSIISERVRGQVISLDTVSTIADATKKYLENFENGNNAEITLGTKVEQELCEGLTKLEKEWLLSKTGVQIENNNSIITRQFREVKFINKAFPVIAKWRSAEQHVIQIEEFLGNVAIDVSKQNIGYDVESRTPDGSIRRIEVKLLPTDIASFSITNNEYTAAHQYGEEYFICLISTGRATYINNPLSSLVFEKRIKQWEWLCEDYKGTVIEFINQ